MASSCCWDLDVFLEGYDVRLCLWDSPCAVFLDCKVVSMHLNSKESCLSPICSPAVSSNPILNSVFFAPSYNCNLVIDHWNELGLWVDSSCIGLEFFGGFNSAADWSSGEDLSFHFICTWDWSVLLDFPNWITLLSPAVLFLCWVSDWCAVSALLDVRAAEFVWVFSKVGLAGLFRDSVLVCINIHLDWVSSVAASSSLAIDDNLGRQGHIWPSPVSQDVDSVGDWGSRSMSPAAAAVSWDMLVSSPGQIVNSWDVSPVPGFWQIANLEILVRTRRCDEFRFILWWISSAGRPFSL